MVPASTSQDGIASLILALKAAQDDDRLLKWITAISAVLVPALSALGVWLVTRWQLRKEHAQRDREQLTEREQSRLREFRIALANWASALYKSTESQRDLIFALRGLHKASDHVEIAERETMGLVPPDDIGRRRRNVDDARARLQKGRDSLDQAHRSMIADSVEVRTTSFQASIHAPSLDLKKTIREIIASSNLDATTQAMLSQYNPAELEKIAAKAKPEAVAVLDRVHAMIDAQL